VRSGEGGWFEVRCKDIRGKKQRNKREEREERKDGEEGEDKTREKKSATTDPLADPLADCSYLEGLDHAGGAKHVGHKRQDDTYLPTHRDIHEQIAYLEARNYSREADYVHLD
jgi:hypothetical protein